MLVRRLLLVVMVLTVPALATFVLRYVSMAVLAYTGRIVTDPQGLFYITVGEFALFTFGALLEARSRWSASLST